jgi:hypothetical protein
LTLLSLSACKPKGQINTSLQQVDLCTANIGSYYLNEDEFTVASRDLKEYLAHNNCILYRKCGDECVNCEEFCPTF